MLETTCPSRMCYVLLFVTKCDASLKFSLVDVQMDIPYIDFCCEEYDASSFVEKIVIVNEFFSEHGSFFKIYVESWTI